MPQLHIFIAIILKIKYVSKRDILEKCEFIKIIVTDVPSDGTSII